MSSSSSATFRILGFPVSIGISFPLFLAFLGYLSRFTGAEMVIWVAFGMTAILLHELGHALAFRRFGLESTIRFWMLGGLAIPNDQEAAERLSNRRWVAVGLAGPAVGLALGAVGLVLLRLFDPQHGGVRFGLMIWIFVNFVWGLFNLLPIAALDGGQVLRHLTLGVFGERARAVAAAVSIAASAAVAILAYAGGLLYVALIAIIFGVANPAQYQELLDGLIRGREKRRLRKQDERAGP